MRMSVEAMHLPASLCLSCKIQRKTNQRRAAMTEQSPGGDESFKVGTGQRGSVVVNL